MVSVTEMRFVEHQLIEIYWGKHGETATFKNKVETQRHGFGTKKTLG